MPTLEQLKARALALADLQTTGGESYLSSDELTQQINLAIEELEAVHDQMGTGRDRIQVGNIEVPAGTNEVDLSAKLPVPPYRVLRVYKLIGSRIVEFPLMTDPEKVLHRYTFEPSEFPAAMVIRKENGALHLVLFPHTGLSLGILYRWRYPLLVDESDSAGLSELEAHYVALTVAIYVLQKQERDYSHLVQMREVCLSRWPLPANAAGPRHSGTTRRG